MRFRDATPDDGPAIAQLVIAASLHAFEDLLSPVELARLSELERETGEWGVRLADPHDHIVFVAEQSGRVIGVAAWLSPRGPRLLPARDAHLTHLYVHPVAQGAGLGRQLLTHAEDGLRAIGGQTAQLALHDENAWTAALLSSAGWVREPDRPDDMGPNHPWRRAL